VTEAPDLATPIAGWRVWLMGADEDGPTLVSPVAPFTWPSRTATTAGCRSGCPDAPAWECHCGLYATADLRLVAPMVISAGAILGCTALWGRVVEATDGWRAEHAYPLVLFAPTVEGDDRRRQKSYLALARIRSSRLPGSRPVGPPDAATTRALGRRYAVPAHPLPRIPRLAVWESAVSDRAEAVRDEAARGLASRRLGDRDAEDRFAHAVEDMLAALRGR
jgi:hypothetical protein